MALKDTKDVQQLHEYTRRAVQIMKDGVELLRAADADPSHLAGWLNIIAEYDPIWRPGTRG